MQSNDTIHYYNQNAEQFIKNTVTVDFSAIQNLFLSKLKKGSRILDFGCGSGRDTKYFLEQGYQVTAVDGSAKLCELASIYTGLQVKQMMFQELHEQEIYDGIWACSSILHLPYAELEDVFGRMIAALKKDGILYTSFKYGIFEGERNGRYFTDMTESKFLQLLNRVENLEEGSLKVENLKVGNLEVETPKVGRLKVENQWVSPDVRPGRGEENWLNLILRKI